MPAIEDLLAIERQLWSNDAEIYAATYLPEAVLVFPDVGRISLGAAVDAILEENNAGRAWAEVTLEAATLLELEPGVCLLTYHAVARWNDQPAAEHADCLTVYVRRNDVWRVAAHQQTKAG